MIWTNTYLLFVCELVSIELLSRIFVTDDKTLDKKTENPIYFIDLKSEALRDILRTVLQNVKGICLREDKPMVWLFLSHTNRLEFLDRPT